MKTLLVAAAVLALGWQQAAAPAARPAILGVSHVTIQTSDLAAKYELYMAKPPTMQPWGLRVLYLSDPTGVLWHIADRPAS